MEAKHNSGGQGSSSQPEERTVVFGGKFSVWGSRRLLCCASVADGVLLIARALTKHVHVSQTFPR